MKLGFYYHISIISSPEGVRVPSFLGVFIDSLASEVSTLMVFAHAAQLREIQSCDYVLKSQNVEWINLGNKTPFWDRVLFPGRTLNKIKNEIAKCHCTIVRAPSPLAPYFYFKFKRKTKISFLMVGDYVEGMKTQKETFCRKIPVYLLTYLNEYLQNKAIRNCTTFVNSRVLKNKYLKLTDDLHEIRTTTISKSDFYKRCDSFDPISDEINLLYTGRITTSKGVLDLVEVATKLISKGRNIVVHFVGWEDNPSKPVEREIKAVATKSGILDKIKFHGKKSVGPELFAMYRMAQIYVLPSRSDSEGFPRTIWEAMSNSIPVVTTRVGSIPYFIENEKHALLVKPFTPDELYLAIDRIITDELLRKSIIAKAFDFVKEITLEVQTKLIIKILEEDDFQRN